jgi:hypothetical protein
MELADEVDVFYGELSPGRARIYARVASLPGGHDWSLSGSVRGPFCRHARTLPAEFDLRDCGDGPTLLAQAVVVDPCVWSPSLPAVYEVQVELRRDQQTIARMQQSVGLRNLGVMGSDLRREGRRWVLRGVHRNAVTETDLSHWKDAAAALMLDGPDDAVCQAASEEGVFVVVRLGGSSTKSYLQLRQLSRYPAVAMVLLDEAPAPTPSGGQVGANLLRGQWLTSGQDKPAVWAQVVFWEAGDPADVGPLPDDMRHPWIAVRRTKQRRSVNQARTDCDRLQQALVRYGDFAGYVIA